VPSSIRERLLQAVAARVAPAVAALGASTHRSPTVALTREQAPALAVFPESDRIRERPNDRVERELVIRLVAITRSVPPADPATAADALLVAAHAALFTDPTFGGLALGLRELDAEWDLEDADASACAIPTRYELRYRTFAHDLTQTG
jgi:hypothetical protein